MKRYALPVILIAGVILLFCGACATNLGNIAVSDLKLVLKEGDLVRESLVPGKTYTIGIEVFDKKGERVQSPDMSSIELKSPNGSFSAFTLKSKFELEATATPASFQLLDTSFQFVLEIKSNSYPRQSYSWPVDWAAYTTIFCRGENGLDGADGGSIADAVGCCLGFASLFAPGSKDKGDGDVEYAADGDDGEAGTAGKDGAILALDVAYYLHNDQPGVIVFDRNSGRLCFMPLRRFTIDASGGDGGRGGNATDGNSAADKNDVAGDGGDGGTGGDGGNGGDITVFYATGSAVADLVTFVAEGGRGGRGGEHGEGGSGAGGDSGEDGRDGRDGRSGRLPDKKAIAPALLFQNVTDPKFNRENLSWTIPQENQ
jgi:hypothetical protein